MTAVATRRCFAEKRDANAAGMVKPDRREGVGRAQHDRTLGGSHVLVFVSGVGNCALEELAWVTAGAAPSRIWA